MKKFISLMVTAGMLAMVGCTGGTNSDSGSGNSEVSDSANVSDNAGAENSQNSSGADQQGGSDSEVNSQGTAPETEQVAPEDIDYSTLSEEEIYQLMVERSLMTTGDMTRMANVLKKAENGEEITVSYIGGSIT
ncbi:MAG: hypothetical protein K2G32_09720, partial [Oscillospiraceae bacterium]|nr:hypothetical protein [Oscillospiraceae bacterium]